MTHKSSKVAALVSGLEGRSHDARYLGYFECFNQGLFYESHDVLEDLWLEGRHGPKDGFYKGLIQFAGAFVHLQKGRLRPSAALFRLSRSYLGRYSETFEDLDVKAVLGFGLAWEAWIESHGYERNPLGELTLPRLTLIGS